MESIILRIASRFIIPLQLALALFLLLRGHNEPGGGFIAGLVAASAMVLHAYGQGTKATRRSLRCPPETWMAVGLLLALASGVWGMVAGKPFMTGLWDGSIPLPVAGKVKLGTPLLFDVGVFLVVFGVTIRMFFSLMEHPRRPEPSNQSGELHS
jgi:multicomponent Na+:H+ antiporter subunit B